MPENEAIETPFESATVDPTVPQNPYGCGIGWLWKLPDSHPFYPACVEHDKAYDARAAGLLPDQPTSAEADAALGEAMSHIVRAQPTSLARTRLEVEGHIFMQLVQVWGKMFWPTPKSAPVPA